MQNEELRKAQVIIENSNKRFSDLYDFAPVGYFTVEPEGRIKEANLTGSELLGFDRGYLIGKPLPVFVHPEDKGDFYRHLISLRKGVWETCEIRLVKRDAVFFYAQLVSTPLTFEAGPPEEFLIAVFDISARKRAEEAKEQTNIFLTNVLDGISDGFFSFDNDFKVTYYNPAAARLLGKKREEVVGRHLFNEAFPEAKGSIFEERYTRALQKKLPDSFETYFASPPYSNWYDVWLYPYAQGICVFFQVITERKKAEAERAHLSAIVENSYDAIISKTLDGIIESWNLSAQKMFGFSEEEIKGKSVSVLAPPDREDEMTGILKKIAAGETVRDFETVRRKKDGTDFPVSLTVSPVKTADKAIIGASTITRDIAEKSLWETSILELNERLLVSNRELEGLRTLAFHDLRAPIISIEGFIGILLERHSEKLDDEAKEFLKIIGDSVHRMSGMHDRFALVVEVHAVIGMDGVKTALHAADRRGDVDDRVAQHWSCASTA